MENLHQHWVTLSPFQHFGLIPISLCVYVKGLDTWKHPNSTTQGDLFCCLLAWPLHSATSHHSSLRAFSSQRCLWMEACNTDSLPRARPSLRLHGALVHSHCGDLHFYFWRRKLAVQVSNTPRVIYIFYILKWRQIKITSQTNQH